MPPFELGLQFGTAAAVQHGIHEPCAQLVGGRRADEQVLQVRGQPVEQLRLHELRQRAAVGRELDDRLPRIGRVAQGQRCEHQCRRPPLGATHQRRDIGGAIGRPWEASRRWASSTVNDRASPRTSASWPTTRRRGTGRSGSLRAAITSRNDAGATRSNWATSRSTRGSVISCGSLVEDEEHRPVAPGEGER